MSADEVTQMLFAWEDRLRNLGAACVDHLRPGLSRAEVDAVAQEFDVRLGDDAAAVWMWHDGDRARHESDWGRPSVAPFGLMLSLRGSLERSRWLREIICEGEDDGDYTDEPAGEELYFRRSYVILIDRQSPTYLDCSAPAGDATPTGIFLSHDVVRTPRLSLADRLRLWHRALDLDAWTVTTSGEWAVDDDARAATVTHPDPRWWLLLG